MTLWILLLSLALATPPTIGDRVVLVADPSRGEGTVMQGGKIPRGPCLAVVTWDRDGSTTQQPCTAVRVLP